VSTAIVTASVSVRRRGILPPGFAARAVFCVCQKIASRPFTCVKTNCERTSRGRSSTRSIAAPRRATEQDRRLLDELGLFGPTFLESVAVDPRGHRPRLARLQHDPVFEREPQQVGQLAVCVWVASDEEDPAAVGHAAAA
jgi:hypothetical protein